jgi:NAD(P) transhydrogenase subunit alpha
MTPEILLLFVFVLAVMLGLELISKVPSALHTPLMSGANAVSGIALVGATIAAGSATDGVGFWLGTAAVALAAVNVVGGYAVTDRMLRMFKPRKHDRGPS